MYKLSIFLLINLHLTFNINLTLITPQEKSSSFLEFHVKVY